MASQTSNYDPPSGWEDQVTDSRNMEYKLISLANKKTPLNLIFAKYGVSLEPAYSTTGWDFKCLCPFSSHNDSSPSFGYNPVANVFNCFGCHRRGGAVEFIAGMDSRARINVARELAGEYSDTDIAEGHITFDFERLRKALFGFADTVRLFKANNNNHIDAIKYSKAVSWSLDVYLQKNASFSLINLDNLEARILILKEQLDRYGDAV